MAWRRTHHAIGRGEPDVPVGPDSGYSPWAERLDRIGGWIGVYGSASTRRPPRVIRRLDRRPCYNFTLSTTKALSSSGWRRSRHGRSPNGSKEASPDVEPDYRNRCLYPTGHDHLFKFAFVRNPWDRLLSCYLDKVVRTNYFSRMSGCSFDDFVHLVARLDLDRCDRHLRRQTALLPLQRLEFVGRFERLDEDLERLAPRLGLETERFPSLNRNVPAEEHTYTKRTVELVGQLYRSDVEAFGYRPTYLTTGE